MAIVEGAGMLSSKRIEGYDAVAACFNNAESVQVNVGVNRYFGKIERIVHGKAIVFRVNNLDNNLVKIPNGFSQVMFKIIGRDNIIWNFQTRLISKKLPRLLLLFPERETEKVERSHARVHTNISTPIILKKRVHDLLHSDNTGMGTIENISEGGCSISTQMDLEIRDTINFFMPVMADEITIDLELHGAVCNLDKVSGGAVRAGVKYLKMDRETEISLMAYMARRLRLHFSGE
jgi:hypothetical protein